MKITDKRHTTVIPPSSLINKGVDEEEYIYDDLDGDDGSIAEQEIVEKIRKFANAWYSVERENIDRFQADLRFLYGDQWSGDLRAVRNLKQKPTMQCNMLKTYVDLLSGEQIQNDPDLIVAPLNPDVPQEEVDIAEGILRQACYENKLSMIKLLAFNYSISGGWGVIEVGYDYENPKTFDKKLTAQASDDVLTYFFDAYCDSPFKDDGDGCGKIIKMSITEYHRTYPDARTEQPFNVEQYFDDYSKDFFNDRTIYLAEAFIKEYYEETIVLLSNGESMTKDEAEEELKKQDSLIRQYKKHEKRGIAVPDFIKEKVRIVQEEKRVCYKIMHYVVNGGEILDSSEWPSEYLPYIRMPCSEMRVNGIRKTVSYHHYAHDPQRYINYLMSEAAEVLMTGHHKNWLAPVECFPGELADMFLHPQNTSPAVMYQAGPTGAKPEYVPPPQLSPAFESQFVQGVNNIQNILGKYEASRGQQGNETSGRAIDKRAAFGNMASIGPYENMNLALELVGNIWLSLVPAVYDQSRRITIRGDDDTEQHVYVNQQMGNDVRYDLSKKKFKCTIKAGVNFEAQRQIRAQWLMQLTQGNPQAMMLLGDLIAEELDFENVNKITDRIHQLQLGYPIPKIIGDEIGEKPAPPPPPQPNPQMMAVQQKAQQSQMDGQLQQQQQQIDRDRLRLDSQQMMQDAGIETVNNHMQLLQMNADIRKHAIEANAEIQKAHLDRGLDLVKHFTGLSHKERLESRRNMSKRPTA